MDYLDTGMTPRKFSGSVQYKGRRSRGTVIIVIGGLAILAALVLGGISTQTASSSKHDIADNSASIAELVKSDAEQVTQLTAIDARSKANSDRIGSIIDLEASQQAQDASIEDLENGIESLEDLVEENTEGIAALDAKIDYAAQENGQQNNRLSNVENIQDGHAEQLHDHDGRIDDLEHAIGHHNHYSSSDSDSESSSTSSSLFSTSFTSSSDFICDRAHICPDAIDRPQDCMRWECTTGYPGGPGRCQEVRIQGCNLAEARTNLLNNIRSATFPAWSVPDYPHAFMPRNGNNYNDYGEFSISLVKFDADSNSSTDDQYFALSTLHQYNVIDEALKDTSHFIVENVEALSTVTRSTVAFVENIDPGVVFPVASDAWTYTVAQPFSGGSDEELDIYAARKPLLKYSLLGTSTRLQIWNVTDPRAPVFVQLIDRAERENTLGSWADVKTYDVTEFRVIMNGCDTRSIVTPGKFVQLQNGKVVRVMTADHLDDDEYFVRVRTLDVIKAGDELPTVEYEIVDVVKHAYAYVVHESVFCSTAQVVDMAGLGPGGSGRAEVVLEFGGCDGTGNPLHEPLEIGNVNFNYRGAHNVYVDQVQGLLWFIGTTVQDASGPFDQDIAVDLLANPASPTIKGFTGAFGMHDFVTASYTCDEQRSILGIPHNVACTEPFLVLGVASNSGSDSAMTLLNVTDPADIITLQTGVAAREGASESLQHQAWFTSDKQYITVADEDQQEDPRYWSRTGIFSVGWHHSGLELREVQQLQSGSIVRNHNGYAYSNRKLIPQSLSTANPMQKDDYLDWYYNAQPFEEIVFQANYASGVEIYRLTYREQLEHSAGDGHSHGGSHGNSPLLETWSEPFHAELIGSIDTLPANEFFQYIGSWTTYCYGEEFLPALEMVHIVSGGDGMAHFKYNEGFVQRELHSSVFDRRSIKLLSTGVQKRHPGGEPVANEDGSFTSKPSKNDQSYLVNRILPQLQGEDYERVRRHAAQISNPLRVLDINMPTADGNDYIPVRLVPVFSDDSYDLVLYAVSFPGEQNPGANALHIPTLVTDPVSANPPLQSTLYASVEDHEWGLASANLLSVSRSSEHTWRMYQQIGYTNSSTVTESIERERRAEHLVQGPFGQGSCGTQLVSGDGNLSFGIVRDKTAASSNSIDGAESSVIGIINGEVIKNLYSKQDLDSSPPASIPGSTQVIGTLNSRMAGITEDDTEQAHVAYISPLTGKFYGHVVEFSSFASFMIFVFTDGPLAGQLAPITLVGGGLMIAESASYSPPRADNPRAGSTQFGVYEGFAVGGFSGVPSSTIVQTSGINDSPFVFRPGIANCGSGGTDPNGNLENACNGDNVAYTYTVRVRALNGIPVEIGEELVGDVIVNNPIFPFIVSIGRLDPPATPGPRVVVVDILDQSEDEYELEVMSVIRYTQTTQLYTGNRTVNPYGDFCNTGGTASLFAGFGTLVPLCASHPPKTTDVLTADVSGAIMEVIDAGKPSERIVRTFLPSFVEERDDFFPISGVRVNEQTGQLTLAFLSNKTLAGFTFIQPYAGTVAFASLAGPPFGAENVFPSESAAELQDSFPWIFSETGQVPVYGGKLGVRAARRTIPKSSTLRVEDVYSHVENIQGSQNEMRTGDVILNLNGVSVTRDNYWVEMAKYRYGEQISVTVLRNEEQVELERTLVIDTDDQFSTV